MMSGYPALFTSPEGEHEVVAPSDAVLKRWPVLYGEPDIPPAWGPLISLQAAQRHYRRFSCSMLPAPVLQCGSRTSVR